MPKRTMTVTRIYYHPLRKTQDRGQMHALPNGGRDLLDVFLEFVQGDIAKSNMGKAENETYATLESVTKKGRSITVITEAGRHGEKGKIRKVSTRASIGEFTEDDAIAVITHGVLLVPKAGDCALVFAERSGGQGGMTALLDHFIEKFAALYPTHRMKKETVVQQEAWLKAARLTKVKGTVRKYTTDPATDGADKVVGELSHTLVPERDKTYFPRDMWEALKNNSVNRAKFLGFADETELDSFDVTASDGVTKKTFEIGDERTPSVRLVLTTSGEPAFDEPKILNKVLDEAADIFKYYGIEWSEADAVEAKTSK